MPFRWPFYEKLRETVSFYLTPFSSLNPNVSKWSQFNALIVLAIATRDEFEDICIVIYDNIVGLLKHNLKFNPSQLWYSSILTFSFIFLSFAPLTTKLKASNGIFYYIAIKPHLLGVRFQNVHEARLTDLMCL